VSFPQNDYNRQKIYPNEKWEFFKIGIYIVKSRMPRSADQWKEKELSATVSGQKKAVIGKHDPSDKSD